MGQSCGEKDSMIGLTVDFGRGGVAHMLTEVWNSDGGEPCMVGGDEGWERGFVTWVWSNIRD
jgi:hypothetical protein